MAAVWDVVVIGSGNAALCAAIAALERGASVLVLEKGSHELAGGNSKYTAGAMRFAYDSREDLLPLLRHPDDPRLASADFGSYSRERFTADLLAFNDGRPLSTEQTALVGESYDVVRWLASHDVKFEPIFSRQSFMKEGRHVFWGGLTLAAHDEGVGLVENELAAFRAMGGEIRYGSRAIELIESGGRVRGVVAEGLDGDRQEVAAGSVILACGGFEANAEWRVKHLGEQWARAKVRGTPLNEGDGLRMAFAVGARRRGLFDHCHATPMDLHMPNYGNLELPHAVRKNYRKICYFLGVMLNARGERFVDEGSDFRNYTYAQFGRAVLEQPQGFAWQIFDAKINELLYEEYHFEDAHFVEAATLPELVEKLAGVDDKAKALATLEAFNAAVDETIAFDPTIKDGRGTRGLTPPKSNWAQQLSVPPFRAYPVTGGITFTYGGLEVDASGAVVHESGQPIAGLFACGEIVGGMFFNGYPGGSGLTAGAVFGRRAGHGAARFVEASAAAVSA